MEISKKLELRIFYNGFILNFGFKMFDDEPTLVEGEMTVNNQ